MKKLILWAVIGLFLFLTLKAGIGFLIGWFLTFLVIKSIVWIADGAGYNRASDYSEWYGETKKGLGVKSPSSDREPAYCPLQKDKPDPLEKLTSSHKFGRCELTYDFKTYYVFEGGRAWTENRLNPEERKFALRNRLSEYEYKRQKELVEFHQKLKEMQRQQIENNFYKEL